MKVRVALPEDKPWIDAFLRENWGADFVVSRGRRHWPSRHHGLIVEGDQRRLGLLTFDQVEDEIEILTLDATTPRSGVGSLLLEEFKKIAKERNARRAWLVTTNDNLDALRFYQRKGFDICAVHRGAVEEARKVKPSIPLIGSFGIPILHEVELEMKIR